MLSRSFSLILTIVLASQRNVTPTMHSSTAPRALVKDGEKSLEAKSGSLLRRKLWLPKILYSALPLFYIASGITAFLATLYINEWFWVLPHYALFSATCIHLGIYIYRRRRQPRKDHRVNQ